MQNDSKAPTSAKAWASDLYGCAVVTGRDRHQTATLAVHLVAKTNRPLYFWGDYPDPYVAANGVEIQRLRDIATNQNEVVLFVDCGTALFTRDTKCQLKRVLANQNITVIVACGVGDYLRLSKLFGAMGVDVLAISGYDATTDAIIDDAHDMLFRSFPCLESFVADARKILSKEATGLIVDCQARRMHFHQAHDDHTARAVAKDLKVLHRRVESLECRRGGILIHQWFTSPPKWVKSAKAQSAEPKLDKTESAEIEVLAKRLRLGDPDDSDRPNKRVKFSDDEE